MNQILSTNNNNNNKNTLGYTKKIIIIFCIILIAFGLAIAGFAGYKFYKSKNKNSKVDNLNKPQIKLEQLEDGIKVNVTYDDGIEKISYTWDDGDKEEINENGKTSKEKLIELPNGAGEHKLLIQALGVDGSMNEITRTFAVENGLSGDKPVIEWTSPNKIFLTATSNVGMKYITYKWNEEGEEVKEEVTEQNPLVIEATIEIPRGTNTLKVKAVDINGNEETKEGLFKGVKEPEIQAEKYGNILKMTVKHDMGFKKIEFIVNDKQYIYDENYAGYDKQETEVQVEVEVPAGKTIAVIRAYSQEDTEKEFVGKSET